jgi:hypothetical protein
MATAAPDRANPSKKPASNDAADSAAKARPIQIGSRPVEKGKGPKGSSELDSAAEDPYDNVACTD